jgi:hypothetical protein
LVCSSADSAKQHQIVRNPGRVVASALLVCGAFLLAPAWAFAEWQIKPFFGTTFAGSTAPGSSWDLIDLDNGSHKAHLAFGVSGLLLGDLFGVEADFGHTPGFFQSDSPVSADINSPLVVGSSATTLTGNLVITVPRKVSQYTLRPYFVFGGGWMHLASSNWGDLVVLPVSRNRPAFDIGGGVTGFLTNRLGLSWDIRRFSSIRGQARTPLDSTSDRLSFWRANMSVAIRY